MIENKIRILICDDHALFREGLISMLDQNYAFVVGQAENGEEMIKKYFQLKPDVILVDISMPKLSGIDALKEIKRKDPSAKALFLSMLEDEQYIYHCYKAGGLGLISKNILKGELMSAINMVFNNQLYFGPNYNKANIEELVDKYEFKKEPAGKYSKKFNFTKQEEKVIELTAQGLMCHEIADHLMIGRRTVEWYRHQAMQKANLDNKALFLKFCIEYCESKTP